MKKEIKEKKLPKRLYQEAFDLLMAIAMADLTIPPRLLEKFDAVADYIGDMAMGRKINYKTKAQNR